MNYNRQDNSTEENTDTLDKTNGRNFDILYIYISCLILDIDTFTNAMFIAFILILKPP